jgi:hypothetical protein
MGMGMNTDISSVEKVLVRQHAAQRDDTSKPYKHEKDFDLPEKN